MGYIYRKLTPLDRWKLMGFEEEDFKKASNGISNTQLVKQAGNSIHVKTLQAIFNNLIKENSLSVNELFSGIGAQRKALNNLNKECIYRISEVDKYAIQAYTQLYGDTKNYGDISKVQELQYADLWTYSFPCTDISIVGEKKGIIKGVTRSGLLYEVERLLNVSKTKNELPKYLMLENVKNLISKRFKPQFDEWLQYLEELGYNNYWKILNAKDFGSGQNRERIFCISIRKDVDDNSFCFPTGSGEINPLKVISDINLVPDKYFITNFETKVGQMIKTLEQEGKIKNHTIVQYRRGDLYETFIPALTTHEGQRNDVCIAYKITE